MKKTDKMILVNGIEYKKPETPIIIICMDGISHEYLDETIRVGKAPTFEKFKNEGFYYIAKSVIPSLTNPNNISIITGVSPKTHRIVTSGLAFNKKKWDYEIITSPEHIKCDTLLQKFNDNNLKVASITTKDKLRHFLSITGDSINISAEVAHKFKNEKIETIIEQSIKETKKGKLLDYVDDKWMYSEKSSHLALDLAIALLKGKGPYTPKVTYVSLTDYIPHRYEQGMKTANKYINGIDKRLKILDDMDCVIGITADHGMNNKFNSDGSPNAIWLKDILNRNNISDYRVLLPVTDKYLAHHSCLGSCAWIYFTNKKDVASSFEILKEVKGIEEILLNKEAADKYGLPEELIGDVFLLSNKDTVLGTTKNEHPNIPLKLRSHGGIHEQKVPFVINKPLNISKKELKRLRNFNIFEYVLNRVT